MFGERSTTYNNNSLYAGGQMVNVVVRCFKMALRYPNSKVWLTLMTLTDPYILPDRWPTAPVCRSSPSGSLTSYILRLHYILRTNWVSGMDRVVE